MDETEGLITKTEFFGELERLNLERETLDDSNQARKIILEDNTKSTATKEISLRS